MTSRTSIGQAAAFLLDVYKEWQKDHPDLLAAGLSYFALFAVTPLLILSTALLGHLWSNQSIQLTVLEKLAPTLGPETTMSLSKWLYWTTKGAKGTASIFSMVVLYLAAARIFAQLRTALDIVWDVAPPRTGFIRDYVRATGKNLIMVVGVTAFIFAFLISDAAMALIIKAMQNYWIGFRHLPLLELAHLVIPILLFTGLFLVVYKVIPDTYIPWRDVWPGAVFTSVLFAIGKSLISFYLGFQRFDTVYGTASSVIIVMVWIYFAAQIFFFGAEFTWLYAMRYGSRSKAPNPKRPFSRRVVE